MRGTDEEKKKVASEALEQVKKTAALAKNAGEEREKTMKFHEESQHEMVKAGKSIEAAERKKSTNR